MGLRVRERNLHSRAGCKDGATKSGLSARVSAALRHTFLPIGYPASVREEYVTYQIWDTVQALCSYLRGVLATKAVLEGVGVGREGATALAATLQWVLRDGSGMIGGLLFSSFCSNRFDAGLKQWRLFADLVNNVGLTLDIVAPLYPAYFLYIICAANVCKAMCGVSAGATKTALTAHFAVSADRIGDVQAKEGAQETLVTLLGMVLGAALATQLEDSHEVALATFAVLTAVHCAANYCGVRCLRLRTLNQARAEIAARMHLAGRRPDVGAVNAAEPLLGAATPGPRISLAAKWADATAGLADVAGWAAGVAKASDPGHGPAWRLRQRDGVLHAVLLSDDPESTLGALFHCVRWSVSGPAQYSAEGYSEFKSALEEAGWDARQVIGVGPLRYSVD